MARTNCPNCNAVLSYEGGLHCDYCGARFERPDGDVVYCDGGPVGLLSRGMLSVNEARELAHNEITR